MTVRRASWLVVLALTACGGAAAESAPTTTTPAAPDRCGDAAWVFVNWDAMRPTACPLPDVTDARGIAVTTTRTFVARADGTVISFAPHERWDRALPTLAEDETLTIVNVDAAAHSPRGTRFTQDTRDNYHEVDPDRLAVVEAFASAPLFEDRGEVPCAVDAGGALHCDGLLGYTIGSEGQPVVVHASETLLEDVVELSGSQGLTCARTRAGSVTCYGGFSNRGNVDPSPVSPPELGAHVASIVAGDHEACGVMDDGRAICFGLFDGDVVDPTTHVAVGLPPVVAIGVGEKVACGLTAEGAVYCFGNNWSGALGQGDLEAHTGVVRVAGIDDAVEIALSAMPTHACVRHRTGRVSCWGEGRDGQIGLVPPHERPNEGP